MLVASLGQYPSPRGALDQALLEQVGLEHVLDRVGLLADSDRQGREPDRASAEFLGDRRQQLAVVAVEPGAVDLEQLERFGGGLLGDDSLTSDLGEVANPPQEAVGDPGGPSRAGGDRLRPGLLDLDLEDSRRAPTILQVGGRRSARGGDRRRSGRAAASSEGRYWWWRRSG